MKVKITTASIDFKGHENDIEHYNNQNCFMFSVDDNEILYHIYKAIGGIGGTLSVVRLVYLPKKRDQVKYIIG